MNLNSHTVKIVNPLLENRHHELRAKIRAFAENEVKPIAPELDSKGEFSQDLFK